MDFSERRVAIAVSVVGITMVRAGPEGFAARSRYMSSAVCPICVSSLAITVRAGRSRSARAKSSQPTADGIGLLTNVRGAGAGRL